jgi:hypothetical protein
VTRVTDASVICSKIWSFHTDLKELGGWSKYEKRESLAPEQSHVEHLKDKFAQTSTTIKSSDDYSYMAFRGENHIIQLKWSEASKQTVYMRID